MQDCLKVVSVIGFGNYKGNTSVYGTKRVTKHYVCVLQQKQTFCVKNYREVVSCLPMLVWKDWYDFTTTRIATSAIAWGIPTATATHVQLLLSAVARLTVKTKLLNTQNNLSSSLTLFRSKRTPFWRETRLVWTFYPRVYSSRDRYNFKTILQDLLDITTKLVKCALKGPFKQMCIKMVPYRKILLGVHHYFSKITSQKKLRRHRKILILTKRAFLRSFFATEASKHKLKWDFFQNGSCENLWRQLCCV